MMTQRWSDERLDDLAMIVHQTAERQSEMRRDVDQHSLELTRLASTGDRRSEHRWQLFIASATVTLAAIANVITTLLHH